EQFGQLLGEPRRRQQVAEADGAPRHLVLVGGPDAAPGGADLVRALARFTRDVQGGVVGQDERAGLGNAQPPRHFHAGRGQFVDLAFSLVAPLSTDDDYVAGAHCLSIPLTCHIPFIHTSSRSQPSSCRAASWPGRSGTTISPAARSPSTTACSAAPCTRSST